MAELNSLFTYGGTFQGVTTVNSRAYGKHIRKARSVNVLNDEMKASTQLMSQANVYAKAFKDAIDPYRRDCKDGMLWQRLVSLFKKQLKKKGKMDFSVLEDEELNKIHPLSRLVFTTAEATQSEKTLTLVVGTKFSDDPTKKSDGWQQTLIVLFADKDLKMEHITDTVDITRDEERREQKFSCEIPAAATTAIAVVKVNFSSAGKPMNFRKGMGMKVVKVVGLPIEGKESKEISNAE